MDSISKDKRFKHAASDPLFKKVPRNERKVKIDKRFQSMFTDKRFQTKVGVDERGRKVNKSQSENYKKFYDLSDSSSESGSESDDAESESDDAESDNDQTVVGDGAEKNDSKSSSESTARPSLKSPIKDTRTAEELNEEERLKEKLREAKKKVNKYVDDIHKQKLNSEIREKLTDFRVDYARGIGTLISEESSSSSDESSSDESDTVKIEHPWGELDKDAEETNEITSRLAVCNMDWDRVTAKDLMVLFYSFLPTDGVIESITVYPSEFGLARMAEEELKGPKELVEIKGDTLISEETEEAEEGSAYQTEKLREYQLKRLKYFYAVIECNSKETANTLYTECDGMEYESSAMKLDLRFISEDVTFEQEPRDKCTSLPDLKKYKPRLFVNTALQQGKVDLTWDETDPDRIDFTKRVLAGEEVDENDFQTYVANSSTEEEEAVEEKNNEAIDDEDEDKGEEDRIKKYRDLLAGLQDTKSKKRGDVEMEVTWGADSCGKERVLTDNRQSDSAEGSSEDFVDSEDEENKQIKQKNNKKALRKKPKQTESDAEEEKQRNAELELLLADDNPEESGLKHFSLTEIQKREKHQKKKKKWQKKKKLDYQEEDSFKINPSDERFSSIYTSHQFNIDPADPHFRKTKAMEQLVVEKLKRRKLE